MMKVRTCLILIVCLLVVTLPSPTPGAWTDSIDRVDGRTLGPDDAPVKVVEYFGFDCPACHHYARNTLQYVIEDFIAPGDVQYTIKHFPLNANGFGGDAAVASECAARQNKFWDFKEEILTSNLETDNPDWLKIANGIGIPDTSQFKQCLDNPEIRAFVKKHRSEAVERGIRSIPSFIVNETKLTGSRDIYRVIDNQVQAHKNPDDKSNQFTQANTISGTHRALIIAGSAGNKRHHQQFMATVGAIHRGLETKYGLQNRATLLTEDGSHPQEPVDGRADRETIRKTIQDLKQSASTGDFLVLFLIGHSSGQEDYWRLNIPGKDLSADKWKALLKDYPGKLGVVISAPRSEFALQTLSADDRVIIASNKSNQRHTWAFREALKQIFSPSSSRVQPTNWWEFFITLDNVVNKIFRRQNYMRREAVLLDDQGNGRGVPAERYTSDHPVSGLDGHFARRLQLGAVPPSEVSNQTPTNSETDNVNSSELDQEILDAVNRELQSNETQNGALRLKREIDAEIDEDKSIQWTDRRLLKLRTSAGRDRANFRKKFPARYRVEVKQARTILPDGTVLQASEQGQITTQGSELLSKATRLNIHLPNPRPGAVLEITLDISINEFKVGDNFVHEFRLQDQLPTEQLEVEISYPSRWEPNIVPWFTRGPSNADIVRHEKTYTTTYRYEARDIPNLVEEPYSLSVNDRTGRIIFTTLSSWDQIARWYHHLSSPVLESNEKLKQLVDKLTDPSNSDLQNIENLYNWVSTNIRYVHIPLGVHGYKPHMVPNIFKWRYGDCKDKASLLMTLMDIYGEPAEMVLIGARRPSLIESAPRPQAFNHTLVAWPRESGDIYMDPTAEYARFGTLPPMDQGRKALQIHGDTGSLVTMSVDPPKANQLTVERSITIQENDLVVEANLTRKGRWALERRHQYLSNDFESKEGFLSSWLTENYGSASLEEFELSGLRSIGEPLKESIRYRLPGAVSHVLELPWLKPPVPRSSQPFRQSTVNLGSTIDLHEVNNVSGRSLGNLNEKRGNELGTSKFVVDGNKVIRTLRINKHRVSPDQFDKLIELTSLTPYPLTLVDPVTITRIPTWIWIIVGLMGAGLVVLTILYLRNND